MNAARVWLKPNGGYVVIISHTTKTQSSLFRMFVTFEQNVLALLAVLLLTQTEKWLFIRQVDDRWLIDSTIIYGYEPIGVLDNYNGLLFNRMTFSFCANGSYIQMFTYYLTNKKG